MASLHGRSKNRTRVSLVRVADDRRETLVAAIDEALALIERRDCIRRGDAVLLKPNLHGGPGHTSPAIIEALCLWAQEQGGGRITIADGGYWALQDGRAYLAQTGMTEVAQRTGARLLWLHNGAYRLIHPSDRALPDTIGIAAALDEADVIINVPIPKTHLNTLVTMALKNLKGCLRPADKRRFHELDLPQALAALNQLLAPRIAVHLLDGLMGYEGLGPSSAQPFRWGLIAASADPVALDATACRLMGIDPSRVRLITESARRGVGVADESAIELVGERPECFRRRFLLPHEALATAFPGLTIRAPQACSVCLESFFQALQQAQGRWRSGVQLSVQIGSGDGKADLLIGRCAYATEASQDSSLRRCPPRPEEIYDEMLKKIKTTDTNR